MATIQDFFDNMAPKWDQMSKENKTGIKTILNITSLPEGAKILDIACGTGILTPYLLAYNPEYILGIDISEKMIEEAKKKFNDPKVKFEAIDFLDLKENNFDYIMCYRSYAHFEDKKPFINQLHKLLKDGGRFVLAHTEGREIINTRHNSHPVGKYSYDLIDGFKEAERFKDKFKIDIIVDTEKYYILSGLKTKD